MPSLQMRPIIALSFSTLPEWAHIHKPAVAFAPLTPSLALFIRNINFPAALPTLKVRRRPCDTDLAPLCGNRENLRITFC